MAYGTQIVVRSTDELARVWTSVRAAVDAGELQYNAFESDRELVGQTSFMQLRFDGPVPEVMRYHFQCLRCGTCYGLFVESHDGNGGKWFQTGRLPPC